MKRTFPVVEALFSLEVTKGIMFVPQNISLSLLSI